MYPRAAFMRAISCSACVARSSLISSPHVWYRLLHLAMRLHLQGFGRGGNLREGGVDDALVERARQVWFASLDQHSRQAGAQARQRPLQHIPLRCWVQWHIAVVLRPGIVVMRLTL